MTIPLSPKAEAVLFDATGTLFRVKGSVGEIYAQYAVAHGLPDQPGLATIFNTRFREQFPAMGRPVYPGTDRHQNDAADHAWWRQLLVRVVEGLGPLDFEPFFNEVFQAFAEVDLWQTFPETREVLQELRDRGLKLAIVSNFDSRIEAICEGLDLNGLVDTVVFSAAVGVAKPDAGIFQHALRELGVKADAAVHVGDSLKEDVQGARAAGVNAVYLRRKRSADETKDDAPWPIITDLHGLPALIAC